MRPLSRLLLAALTALAALCATPQVGAAQSMSQLALRALLAEQPRRLAEAFERLPTPREGVTDVYVLTFAGDGSNPVFLSEARAATAILTSALDARGSVILANDPATRETLPLAGSSTFRDAVRRFGAMLDPDEDVLVTFLTSHGDKDGLLINLPPYLQGQLSVPLVSTSLARSGVRHRVLIVSACHSGVFVDAAKGPSVMVVTAARADRVSFGCSAEREWTYFGDAFFAQSLKQGLSLPDAYRRAAALIDAWEKRDGLEPSLPQYAAGPEIVAKLASLRPPPP